MTAKEYLSKHHNVPNRPIPDLLGVHEDGQEDWGGIELPELMEAYHRAKVEGVTEEQIEKEAQYRQMEGAEPNSWAGGARWAIRKLLNQ